MSQDSRQTDRRQNSQSDHDTIIRVETKLDLALQAIEKLNIALTDGLSKKLDLSDFNNFKETTEKSLADHEKRLRRLETWVWGAIGALTLIEFASKFFPKFS